MAHRRYFPVLVVSLAGLIAWGVSRVGFARADDEPGGKAKALVVPVDRDAATWTTAVEPKPLSRNVKKGLDWLVEHQLPSGGWGEGEEAVQMRQGAERASFRDNPNVADTCIASLALIRSGSTPREGPYHVAICGGVGYVRGQVEQADAESLSVTNVNGTRVQMKLGPNIDTYLATMLLSEAKGRMPDEASDRAVDLALHKVIGKIERHQAQNGPAEGQGWAPVLAQAMCGKGINRARQAGVDVSDIILVQAEDAARAAYKAGGWPMVTDGAGSGRAMAMSDARRGGKASRRPMSLDTSRSDPEGSSGTVAAEVGKEDTGRRSILASAGTITPKPAPRAGEDAGRRSMLVGAEPAPPSPADERSAAGARKRTTRRRAGVGPSPPSTIIGKMRTGGVAGVELYGWAACLGVLQDSVNTSKTEAPRLRETLARSQDAKERAEADRKLARIADAEKVQQEARAAVVGRLGDPGFIAGFGSNGGEEFLSYMTLAESLVVTGGDDWKRWDSQITENLERVQNQDGSWSGSHCITGRTYCTSTALLVLMADRTPVPVSAKVEALASVSK
jgi:hypothetical protein